MGHLSTTPDRAARKGATSFVLLDGGTLETVALALAGCQLLEDLSRPMKLRPYQSDLVGGIRRVWSDRETDEGLPVCPLAVLPTGGGKTPVFTSLMTEHDGPSVAIAHRKELVSQMSLTLAKFGVRHRLIAPDNVIKDIVAVHVEELGRHFYDPNAWDAIAGVDSLKRASREFPRWFKNVTLKVLDEGHHLLTENKWGKAWAMFPNAVGLGVTATPERADGKCLGAGEKSKGFAGFYTHVVKGPSMRELIRMGNLCDYRIWSADSHLDMTEVRVTASGDYSRKGAAAAVHKARITGDIVAHYKRHAEGLLGVTFAVDVAAAHEIAAAYTAAGIPAMAVDAKTPSGQRRDALKRFARREIIQLVNVDLFGEGFDVPAMEVVSMARPTKSWPLFVQQFGRPLRPKEGKTHGKILDHVWNVDERRGGHGVPDAPRAVHLEPRRRRKGKATVIRTTTCPKCGETYLLVLTECPGCHHVPEPVARTKPEHVAGDLTELSPEVLAKMRGAVEEVDRTEDQLRADLFDRNVPHIGIGAQAKRHRATQRSQAELRRVMDWWAGLQKALGYSHRESLRKFYLDFGIDALSARALKSADADELFTRISNSLPVQLRDKTA